MNQPAPSQQMFQMITGYWVTQIVATIARLGVADALGAGPRRAAEVATELRVHPDALARVLRAAATVGLVRSEAGGFALTALGETLRTDLPGSLRDMAIAQASPGHWLPWGRLDEVVRTGGRATPTALGCEIWEHYAGHPSEGQAFSRAMTDLSRLVAGDLTMDLADKTIVDVGGAHGALLTALVERNPGASGVLFDLPHVIAGAPAHPRIERIAGDFTAGVPGGDVYVMKQILHDWDDATCQAILARCAASARPGARLFVIEMLLDEPGPAPLMDINMLVMLTGRERTRSEYGALFSDTGWTLGSVQPVHAGFSILEAVRDPGAKTTAHHSPNFADFSS